MGDWAETKAREWLVMIGLTPQSPTADQLIDLYRRKTSLAALLREVKISGEARVAAEQAGEFARGRDAALAEACRVVNQVRDEHTAPGHTYTCTVMACMSEILSRLEKL